VIEAYDDPAHQEVMNGADLVTPDGVPLVWALRLLGVDGATRVYGPYLTPILCERAAALGVPVGFYGGTPEVLEAMAANLLRRHRALQVAYLHSPPFRPLTPDEEAREEAADAGDPPTPRPRMARPPYQRTAASLAAVPVPQPAVRGAADQARLGWNLVSLIASRSGPTRSLASPG
jgi:hypothetical protein